MLVGVARITVDFYNNEKAAAKNRLLEELCADLRKKFNVSAMEIAEQDQPEAGVIGFAAVIPETWTTKAAATLMEKICRHIDETSVARVTSEDWELLEHGPGGTLGDDES